MSKMPAKPEWLKASVSQAGRKIGVDRDNKVIHGYVLAEQRIFEDRRGEFTRASLEKVVELGNAEPNGLKVRLSHPNMSSDGIGKKLGRAKNLFLDDTSDLPMVRGDLHLGGYAEKSPSGNISDYVLTLAEEDPDSFGSSLVLNADKKFRRDEEGALLEDDHGDPMPPIWMPTRLHASDVVDEGNVVTSFLSVEQLDELPDGHVRRVTHALDELFNGQEPDVVRSRCLAFLDRYLKQENDMSDNDNLQGIKELLQSQNEEFNKRFDLLQTKLDEEREARLSAEKKASESAAEERRVKEIQELGSMHQIESEKISEWTRENLSVDDVRKRILADLAEKKKLSNDDGTGDLDGGKDPDEKYKQEYAERKKLAPMVDLSEEQYVLSRRIDDGLEPLTGIDDKTIQLPFSVSDN